MMSPSRDEMGAMGGARGGGGGGGGGFSERGRRPHRHPGSAEVEAEMRLYLDKLREIVPHIPKNRKVTRLELIQHVIDYICDLQHALEDHPGLKDEPTARLLTPPTSPNHPLHTITPPHGFSNAMNLQHLHNPHHHMSPTTSSTRQPLGVLSMPNTLQTPAKRGLSEPESRVLALGKRRSVVGLGTGPGAAQDARHVSAHSSATHLSPPPINSRRHPLRCTLANHCPPFPSICLLGPMMTIFPVTSVRGVTQ